MSVGRTNPLRVLSMPEIPRITGGLVLAAGALGHVIGAGGVPGETAPELAIVAVSSIGLVVSGVIARSSRVTRIAQRSVDLLGSREFRREFIRARRRESPLTLVRLPGPGDVTRPGAESRERLAFLRRGLRRIDLVWLNRGDAYLMMPDTDAASAKLVLERLRHRAPSAFAGSEPLLAAFPEDGLTAAALLATVRGRPLPGPRRAPEAVAVHAATDPTGQGVATAGGFGSRDASVASADAPPGSPEQA